VAYELEDMESKTHLLKARQLGCVPLIPNFNDIMLIKKVGWKDGDSFSCVVVLWVNSTKDINDEPIIRGGTPIELDQLVGTMEFYLLYHIKHDLALEGLC
jgi:hypothetical protein